MEIQWKYIADPPKNKVEALQKQLGINPLLCKLLIQRGFEDYESAKDFFRPNLDKIFDPFLMADMDKAVARLQLALRNNEKIIIYGDYDVDGTTSVALFYGFLKKYGNFKPENILYYIPDRKGEGYGISIKGIDFAKANNVQLIVSLDCGIKSIDKIQYANDLKIDFIICDHHTVGEVMPNAVAVLDPKRPDCHYPFKELSGCGVGFKFLQAFCLKEGINLVFLFEFLDLLAVSIAADMVPITDENRIFSYFGLEKLKKNPNIGLKLLLEVAGISKSATVETLVFVLAPRINAAGRIAHAHAALELLLCENEIEARQLALSLNTTNTERKDFDSNTFLEAIDMLDNEKGFAALNSTVVYNPNWHKGIVGIVASKLVEKYYRPTVVLTESNGMVAGSARSVDGFDIYNAINACAEALEQFGGHKYAAGLTLKEENIDRFKKLFENYVSSTISQDQKTPKLDVDIEISTKEINEKFYNIISQMEPFGPGNMSPIFVLKNVYVTDIRLLKDKHLKFWVYVDNSKTKKISAIGFDMAHKFEILNKNSKIDIAFHLYQNNYQNTSTIELMVKDIKKAV